MSANRLRYGIHGAAAAVALLLFFRYWTRYYAPDEIEGFTRFTGKVGLIFLLASLAVTPLATWAGWKALRPSRRPLGLYAFAFIALHLLIFIGLDYGWALLLATSAMLEQRYTLVGLASFLILAALAATSNQWSMRRLRGNWKRLHRWVYLAAGLAVLHYFMLVKQAYTQPAVYGAILLVLLLARLPRRRRPRRGGQSAEGSG